jgi:hypothetical protein
LNLYKILKFQELGGELRSNVQYSIFRDKLSLLWSLYQVEEVREPEEECEASDKDDWQIEMPVASEDYDSPHHRNKQRLSC